MIRVALTMKITHAAEYDEARDSISHDWIRRLGEWGMTAFPIPNAGKAAPAILDAVAPDLLVLTGGADVGAMPARDETETALLAHALDAGVPVLGVCRGMQLINLHLGGRLAAVDGHVDKPHPVTVAEFWRPLYGDTATVNSFHGQGVAEDGVGSGLAVAAIDGDGLVEGLCHPEKPLAGVMWHPERLGAPAGDRKLISALAEGKVPWRRAQ